MKTQGSVKKAFLTAFPHTIPIFAGFWFLGLTYGIYMNVSGFSFWYPLVMSLTIFAGSMEFITVNLLLGAFNPLQAFAMTLMINARHLFYGISMLDKYRGAGWKKFYLIFGMCDESFSINYAAEIPADVDRGWFMFFVTLLDHFYWVFGATLGGIFGSLIHFNTEGLDFAMTALFVVIFLEQWLKDTDHTSAVLGLALSLLCLIAFGADNFIIPSMIAILGILTLLRKPLEAKEDGETRKSQTRKNEIKESEIKKGGDSICQ
ncbi:MAG: azaleucine resistance protein AzlC [Lachnospiraceae bacterium]